MAHHESIGHARTLINVEGRLENYAKPFFGPMQIATIRPMHARAFVAELVARGLAPSTVKAIVLTSSQVLSQCVVDGLIARSPFADVDFPRSGTPRKCTTSRRSR